MFRVGDRVHYPAQGLGTIEREMEHEGVPVLFVRLDVGSGIGVPIASAAELLWPLPSKERALALEAQMLTPAEPDNGSWPERYATFERALLEGTLDDYVEVLCRNLARAAPASFGERKMMMVLEDNAVAPVAESLGKDRAALMAEAAARQAAGR